MNRSLYAATALVTVLSTLAAQAETLRFAVTDIEGLEALQQEFGAFELALEAATGHEIELFAVSSRTSAVEAINQGQVDLILTGPAEYVVIKELADPVIVAGWQRPNYYAQIVTLADASVDAILHDPPRFGVAGDLYSQAFYDELARVLRRRGRLFHYTGTPNQLTSGRDVPGEVTKRLQRAGFVTERVGDGVLARRK